MMDTLNLIAKFDRIGARLKVPDRPGGRGGLMSGSIRLDVRLDRDGEYFEVTAPPLADPDVAVLDVQPGARHLLLLVRNLGEKSKYLCGHDERHWFVAAVPEAAPVGTVSQAMEALKPPEVRLAQAQAGLKGHARHRRKNDAFRRQGEWFFLPVPDLVVDEALVLRNEPLTRGNGSKPHRLERCYRTGGEAVRVCARHPNGVRPAVYDRIVAQNPAAAHWNWRWMQRNPEVYARGDVRHADHATITLHGWHRVVMNTETQARAMRHVAFLD